MNIERNENTKIQAKALAETAESLGKLKLVFLPVAADLQSDAKYYKDLQSVKQ
ncbi:MAG: hypothetical protein IKK04_05720 [Bacteroidales bacterium]|nr:hypothetical protein [Bacteroidales bacterium]